MVNLEKHFTALLIFGSFLFVNVCYSNDTTHSVPSNTPQTTTQTTPVEVKTGKAVNAIHNQAKFWGGLVNAKRQMEKMEKDREELAKTIPRGEIRKYDVVVKGTEFVGFMETDKPQLRPGDSKTVAIVEIKGTCPTKAEIASREAAQKAESERLAMEAAAKAEREVNFTSAYAIETVIIEKKQFQDIDDIKISDYNGFGGGCFQQF